MVGDTPKYANYEAKYNFGSGLIAYLSDKLIANFLIIFGPLQTLELRYVNLSNKTELRISVRAMQYVLDMTVNPKKPDGLVHNLP